MLKRLLGYNWGCYLIRLRKLSKIIEHGNLIAKMKLTHKTTLTSRKDKNRQLSIHLESLISLFVIQLLKFNSFEIELYCK